jgi:hypothetical protein
MSTIAGGESALAGERVESAARATPLLMAVRREVWLDIMGGLSASTIIAEPSAANATRPKRIVAAGTACREAARSNPGESAVKLKPTPTHNRVRNPRWRWS